MILEIHYDNPTLAVGRVDTSGFRAYYVNKPRTQYAREPYQWPLSLSLDLFLSIPLSLAHDLADLRCTPCFGSSIVLWHHFAAMRGCSG